MMIEAPKVKEEVDELEEIELEQAADPKPEKRFRGQEKREQRAKEKLLA